MKKEEMKLWVEGITAALERLDSGPLSPRSAALADIKNKLEQLQKVRDQGAYSRVGRFSLE